MQPLFHVWVTKISKVWPLRTPGDQGTLCQRSVLGCSAGVAVQCWVGWPLCRRQVYPAIGCTHGSVCMLQWAWGAAKHHAECHNCHTDSPRAPAEAAWTEMPEGETRWAIDPDDAVVETAGVNKLFFVLKGHQIYCPPLCWIEIKQEYRTPFDSFSVFLIFRSYIPSRNFKIAMNRGQSTLERKTE